MSRSAAYTQNFVCVLVSGFLFLMGLTASSQTPNSLKAIVTDTQVQLSWLCDQPSVDHFIMEQSSDDQNFKTIGVIRFTKGQKAYTYDYAATKGRNSFRVKQVYAGMEPAYSNTVSLNVGYKISVTAFPNPSTGRFTLSHPLAVGKEQVQISDKQGTVVFQTALSKSAVHTLLDLTHLPKGTYHLLWQNEFEKVTLQLFIQ